MIAGVEDEQHPPVGEMVGQPGRGGLAALLGEAERVADRLRQQCRLGQAGEGDEVHAAVVRVP
ncbi:hypothetical protein [Actinomadura nitritigenes]|uniref:Uncharacterized protein n=1 Tax=Actinomadura nitritigenes TaxID=134602 RepID=A0ABS3RAP8_9ACTN|nr:hypothetical protein [Actinomadura nitritigenes]MBO2443309.1 hypothetical protein [Actinomadura nitritigenes]